MSYQSTTPNLGLPQWVLSDGPQMSDFNGAFQDIDNFAGEKRRSERPGNAGFGRQVDRRTDRNYHREQRKRHLDPLSGWDADLYKDHYNLHEN